MTERQQVGSDLITGSVFARITIPSELEPTAAVGDCDYYGERLNAGISMGMLRIAGLVSPIAVEPESYIDGTIYEQYLPTNALADGAAVTATFEDSRGPVVVDAVAPVALASANLPDTVAVAAPPSITWAASDADQVSVTLALSGLGTTRVLVCRTADTGSFAFPQDALALIEGTESDASLQVTRRNIGETVSESADAAVTLAVESQVWRSITFVR